MDKQLQPTVELAADEDLVRQLRTAIVSFLMAHPGTTLAELEMRVAGVRGDDCSWTLGDSNVVIWPQLSAAGALALTGLRRDGAIKVKPCDVFLYHYDGLVPSLPVAKSAPPPAGFKRPRWLPVTLSAVRNPGRPRHGFGG